MTNLPTELSLTDFARLTGMSREQALYRAERGGLPTRRVTPGNPRSKRVILLSVLQASDPDLWSALVLRCQIQLHDAGD